MEWFPAPTFEVVRFPWLETFSETMPSACVPSKTTTDPPGFPEPTTTTLNVTDWPRVAGFTEGDIDTVVGLVPVPSTIWFSAEDLLPAKFASPSYWAKMRW